MEQLTGTTRHYPWGSRTLLADLRGTESPSRRPEAEIWFGAHPAAPSHLGERSLIEVIADDPVAALGERVAEKFNGELPFLVKLLAADEPLSLQAHPSAEQAREGYERENADGIDLHAGHRNYKDPFHKPEIIVALTDFAALAGFRPLARTRELFDVLACQELRRYTDMLSDDPAEEAGDLRALFTTWISIPAKARRELTDAVVACARAHLDREDWIGEALSCVVLLEEQHPGDIGVLSALLLNCVKLAPGEAVHLDAGQLHAYLYGMGVEVMANSDNVLRGGLTSKYVDVPELVRVLDFESLADPRAPESDGEFPLPIEEFTLARHEVGADGLIFEHDGPAIVLCTAGVVQCGDVELAPGQAAWVPGNDPAAEFVSSDGAELFIARA